MTELKETAIKVLNCARSAGADQAEVYLKQSRETVITVSGGQVEQANIATIRGFGLKFLKKGKKVFIDSSDFSVKSIEETIARASQLIAYADEDPYNTIAPMSQTKNAMNLNDTTLKDLAFEQKVDYLKQIEKEALAFDARIEKATGVGYNENLDTVLIANTNGLLWTYPCSNIEIETSIMAKVGDDRQEGEAGRKVHFFKDLPKPGVIAAEACSVALELIGGKPVNTQQATVVFDPRASWSIIRYGIFEAVKGDHILQQSSYLCGKLGHKIASPLVTIIDDGTMPGGVKTVPCDDEGTPTERKTIIDRGVLKMYVYDLYAANKAGQKPTGNAFRRSYRSPCDIHGTNLFMEKGIQTPHDIIAEVKNGFLVKNTIGFGVDSVTGVYSMGASGRWIQNGKLLGPVSGVTIASSLEEILLGIDAVGNDLVFHYETATPTIRVKTMTISGIS